jgi:hypothetical protein
MARSTFTRHARKSTFVCDICKHNTRITTQPDDSHLCALCYDLAGYENSEFDGCFDQHCARAVRDLLTQMTNRGGDLDQVKRQFTELMAAVEREVGA